MLPPRRRLLLCLFIIAGVLVSVPTFAENKRTQRSNRAPKKPVAAAPTPTKTPPLVFASGETLAYTATLNELPAGDGELRLRKEQQDGREVYRFTAQARSNELVDYLYQRRDAAEALFTATNYAPVSFWVRSTENDRQREYGVEYDPQTQQLIGRATRRNRTKERMLPAGAVYDPVSALYLLRSRNFLPGATLEAEVFTGRGHYRVLAQVVGKETVELSSGRRSAIRLHPEVFSLDKASPENLLPSETTLWVTTDAAHTPLKVESYLPFGCVVVELNEQAEQSTQPKK